MGTERFLNLTCFLLQECARFLLLNRKRKIFYLKFFREITTRQIKITNPSFFYCRASIKHVPTYIFLYNYPLIQIMSEDHRSIEPKNEEDEAEEATMETEEENQEDVSKDVVEEYPRESSESEKDSSNDSSETRKSSRLRGRKPKNEEDEDGSEEIPEESKENPLMETEAENQDVPKYVTGAPSIMSPQVAPR